MKPQKIKFTITVRADIGTDTHTKVRVVELGNVADTTAEQAVDWFISIARDGWRRWFEFFGLSMRVRRLKRPPPFALREYKADDDEP